MFFQISLGYTAGSSSTSTNWSEKKRNIIVKKSITLLFQKSVIRLHNWISLVWMVTRLPWIAMSFTWSNIRTRKSSLASWRARRAVDWKRKFRVGNISWTISLTRRWNGSFRMRSSVLFWYRRISRRATVPGRKRLGFLTPPVSGLWRLPCLVFNCCRGHFPPVLFLAVCFVRAIVVVVVVVERGLKFEGNRKVIQMSRDRIISNGIPRGNFIKENIFVKTISGKKQNKKNNIFLLDFCSSNNENTCSDGYKGVVYIPYNTIPLIRTTWRP